MLVHAIVLNYSHGPVVLGTVAARIRILVKCSKGLCIHLHGPPAPDIPRPVHQGIQSLYPKWVTQLPWAYQCLGFKGETHQLGKNN
jgi:hypothetical protein